MNKSRYPKLINLEWLKLIGIKGDTRKILWNRIINKTAIITLQLLFNIIDRIIQIKQKETSA